MYVSNKIQFNCRKDLEENKLECIWIEVYLKKSQNYLIGTIYQPPDGSKYLPTCFNNSLHNMLSNVITKSREVTLLGDTNVDYRKKNDNLAIKNISHLYGFQQIVTKPTRITEYSKTLIDAIFATDASTISAQDVIPRAIADHDMVGYIRKINCIRSNTKTIRCRNYVKYDHVKMCKELREINWEPLYTYTDVNAAWCFIKDKLNTVFNRHVPFIEKRVKDRFSSWLSSEIRQQMNKADKG